MTLWSLTGFKPQESLPTRCPNPSTFWRRIIIEYNIQIPPTTIIFKKHIGTTNENLNFDIRIYRGE